MPAIAAIPLFTIGSGALAVKVTVGVVAMVALSAGSVVYSQQQAKKMEKKARAAMLANQGMTLTSRDSAAQRRIIYGEMRVGGTFAFMNTHVLAVTADAPLNYLSTISPDDDGEPFETCSTALHEAAHAIVARMVGYSVHGITMDKGVAQFVFDNERDDVLGVTLIRDQPNSVLETRAQRLMMVALAGTVATNCLLFRRDPISEDDFATAFQTAFHFCPTDPLGAINGVCDLLARVVRLEPVAEAIFRLAALMEREGGTLADTAQFNSAWEEIAQDLPQIQIDAAR